MSEMPVVEMMKKYVAERNVIFHMPGHKGGRAFKSDGDISFLAQAGAFDLTEVPGTDNLNFPEGSIKIALEKCARAFGADKSFFLVNGSTCGIHAMIAASCRPGDKLIVSRDCHRSVINAMAMFNVDPVFVYPREIKGFGITGGIFPEDLEETLISHPDAVGVLITRPTYYGVCSDIKAISHLVHKYNKIFLVDEAHGGHLSFGGDEYPDSAIGYADACVQSAHKTLQALNQGAYLHLKGNRISTARISKIIASLQTSSPSYLIMASLDYSRHLMESEGKEKLSELYREITVFKNRLARNTGYKILHEKYLNSMSGGRDSLCADRIVINVSDAGLTGFEAGKILRQKFNIQVEMADIFNVVMLCTIFNEKKDFNRIYDALKNIWDRRDTGINNDIKLKKIYDFSSKLNIKRERLKARGCGLFFKETEMVEVSRAVGRVAGDSIVPYPPGIPFIFVGEYIDIADIEIIKSYLDLGAEFNGLSVDNDTGEVLVPCFVEEA